MLVHAQSCRHSAILNLRKRKSLIWGFWFFCGSSLSQNNTVRSTHPLLVDRIVEVWLSGGSPPTRILAEGQTVKGRISAITDSKPVHPTPHRILKCDDHLILHPIYFGVIVAPWCPGRQPAEPSYLAHNPVIPRHSFTSQSRRMSFPSQTYCYCYCGPASIFSGTIFWACRRDGRQLYPHHPNCTPLTTGRWFLCLAYRKHHVFCCRPLLSGVVEDPSTVNNFQPYPSPWCGTDSVLNT